MLLAPNGTSLKKLGDVIGRPKIELPEGSYERMDLLLKRDPELFKKYALEDAIIAALYYLKIRDVMRKDLGVVKHVATLAAAGVKMIDGVLLRMGLLVDGYFGYARLGRARHWLPSLLEIFPFAANCFHGGRNEAYRIGLTPEGVALFDADLKGAYTTALAMMRVPAWRSAAATTDIKRLAVVDEALTFARVRFQFDDDIRFPSLPVRAGARGLIYPLSGVSWCTGAELVVAIGQGARITVESGWRCEWVDGSPRPFEAFTRQISDIRKRAKADGNALLDQTAKEIGNSCYGKIAQSVDALRSANDGGVDGPRGKRVFDARSGMMKTLPGSRITNPMLAAFVTGIVRATISEALAGLPSDAIVCTATTDGFLSSIPLERLPSNGTVAIAFAAARARLSPAIHRCAAPESSGVDGTVEQAAACQRIYARHGAGRVDVVGLALREDCGTRHGGRFSMRRHGAEERQASRRTRRD
jgi:DNA polymerase type B, organellar and viral